MDKSMLMSVVLVVTIAAAGGVLTTYALLEDGPEYAKVLAVTPVRETISTPREICQDIAVTDQTLTEDQYRIAGAVIDADSSDLPGSQIVDGENSVTAVDASGDGRIGNGGQENMPVDDAYTAAETLCYTVMDISEEISGYQVKYELNGRIGQIRMAYAPEERIPVDEHGQPVPVELK